MAATIVTIRTTDVERRVVGYRLVDNGRVLVVSTRYADIVRAQRERR